MMQEGRGSDEITQQTVETAKESFHCVQRNCYLLITIHNFIRCWFFFLNLCSLLHLN